MIPQKTFHIITYGCQMNVYDSSRMNEVLQEEGYREVLAAEDASLVILNTCHIREKAAEKVFSEVGRLRVIRERRKQLGGDMIIGVAGCVAQAQGDEIIKRAPAVDLVFGPQSYQNLPTMLKELAEKGRVLSLDFTDDDKFDHLPEKVYAEARVQNSAAFLSIQEGCDKFCTYCVVPYTRGAEYSRPVDKIMGEALSLVKAGAKEITLLGQNVNAWHGQSWDGSEWELGQLIRELADIKDLERIRYTTSYPAEMTQGLLQTHHDVEKLMPYLHLPVQAGSNRILKLMNRRHTADDYRQIVEELRKLRPDIALSSDFIVGFPGESDKDFEDTLNLVKEVQFFQAYSFKYSPRPGTPAAEMDAQVEEHVKSERLQILQSELTKQTEKFNQGCLNKEMPILFSQHGRKERQIIGRSPYSQPVHVYGDTKLIGQIHNVKITKALPNSMAGELI
ncbi:MAG: tRNA (N6-isopentenyl adenosine(37)-C2)-methylthiotransferase MiaB [Alphaproteobacteria bacterium]